MDYVFTASEVLHSILLCYSPPTENTEKNPQLPKSNAVTENHTGIIIWDLWDLDVAMNNIIGVLQ